MVLILYNDVSLTIAPRWVILNLDYSVWKQPVRIKFTMIALIVSKVTLLIIAPAYGNNFYLAYLAQALKYKMS